MQSIFDMPDWTNCKNPTLFRHAINQWLPHGYNIFHTQSPSHKPISRHLMAISYHFCRKVIYIRELLAVFVNPSSSESYDNNRCLTQRLAQISNACHTLLKCNSFIGIRTHPMMHHRMPQTSPLYHRQTLYSICFRKSNCFRYGNWIIQRAKRINGRLEIMVL